MMTMYDPPSGWRYGFPRPYEPWPGETIEETLVRDGYPVNAAADGGKHCRFWDVADNDNDNAPVSNHAANINALCAEIHADNVLAGWWTDLNTGESIIETRNVPEMLCLIHSEISEAMEGHRKNLMDDKLPHRKMMEVELADAVIRIFDLAGSRGYDLGGAIQEKRAFNKTRADHKPENRKVAGGKAF